MTEEQRETGMRSNNRTWLCTVLFMDIVEYTKHSVDQQMMLKQSFSTLVTDALRSLPREDCIKLDTGDGLAMCYLGAPEDVLYVAIGLRDAFADISTICETCYSVRMGINLGPVKILEDINGQRNAIGDGINSAQRIMSFARPNQLLVSRAYYEVISCLSDQNPKMFAYFGVHSDKHVRKYDVYEVLAHQHGDNVVVEPSNEGPGRGRVSAGSQNDDKLDERILRIVQQQLALIIGPMAGVLVKRAMRRSSSLDELYQLLAEEIPTAQERERFLSARDRLN